MHKSIWHNFYAAVLITSYAEIYSSAEELNHILITARSEKKHFIEELNE